MAFLLPRHSATYVNNTRYVQNGSLYLACSAKRGRVRVFHIHRVSTRVNFRKFDTRHERIPTFESLSLYHDIVLIG